MEGAGGDREQLPLPLVVGRVHGVEHDRRAARGLGREGEVAGIAGRRLGAGGSVRAAGHDPDAVAALEQEAGEARADLTGAEDDVEGSRSVHADKIAIAALQHNAQDRKL